MGKIYHYTKIDTLEVILENQTIRLNALKNMDDLLEGKSSDDFDFSPYLYASSWTKCKEESIPMWSLYTDKMNGIRIEANDDFLIANVDTKDCHIKNCKNEDAIAFQICNKDNKDEFLVSVEYTDTKPRFLTGNVRGYMAKEHYMIGRVKPVAWSFQEEVRFLLQGISKKNIVKFGNTLFERYMNSVISCYENNLKFIDLKFDLSKWNDANFILGPNTTEDDLKRVEKMVSQYINNFSGNIKKSDLKIRF